MSVINRFSSRRQRLDHDFLGAKLKGAKSYKRIEANQGHEHYTLNLNEPGP